MLEKHLQKLVYKILFGYFAIIIMTGAVAVYLLVSFIRFFPDDEHEEIFMQRNCYSETLFGFT